VRAQLIVILDEMITVVAAVIEREGRILIGQRQAGDTHAGKWEFPGGKVEPGESPTEALERELREELGIEAVIGEEIVRYEYSYGGKPPLMLIFKRVSQFRGEPSSRAFQQIRWLRPADMPEIDFLAGDIDFVRRIASGELG
jgi:8-oxo-dGTP diphosphatase